MTANVSQTRIHASSWLTTTGVVSREGREEEEDEEPSGLWEPAQDLKDRLILIKHAAAVWVLNADPGGSQQLLDSRTMRSCNTLAGALKLDIESLLYHP